MNNNKISILLKSLLIKNSIINDVNDISETTNLVRGIGIDSFAIINLAVDIEEIFGFEFEIKDLLVDNFRNIESIIKIINKNTNELEVKE